MQYSTLQTLHFQDQLNTHLEDVLAKQCHLEARLRSVGKAITGLTIAQTNACELSGQINQTSELSENVSMKVRRLDEARVSLVIWPPNPLPDTLPYHF